MSFISTGVSVVGSGCPKWTPASSSSSCCHVVVCPCPISLHQIPAWEDCCGTLFSVPACIIFSKVSFEVVVCHSIPNSSLYIRVLVGFPSPYSPASYTFVFVTPQVGPSLHTVLTKVHVVEIPEASGLCMSTFFLFKWPVIIYIHPHVFLSFLWSSHWEFEGWKSYEIRELFCYFFLCLKLLLWLCSGWVFLFLFHNTHFWAHPGWIIFWDHN